MEIVGKICVFMGNISWKYIRLHVVAYLTKLVSKCTKRVPGMSYIGFLYILTIYFQFSTVYTKSLFARRATNTARTYYCSVICLTQWFPTWGPWTPRGPWQDSRGSTAWAWAIAHGPGPWACCKLYNLTQWFPTWGTWPPRGPWQKFRGAMVVCCKLYISK